jgi:heterodisulfide reductase subunit A-like polyferredoxin
LYASLKKPLLVVLINFFLQAILQANCTMMNLGSDGLRKRVAIVGAGPLGLIATKNFVEEGFDVTTFERNEYVGGLWHITSDPTQTCVLPGTITNTSKLTVHSSPQLTLRGTD